MLVVVTDTGPLWSFAAVGRLDLLGERLRNKIAWTTAVSEEVKRNAEQYPFLADLQSQDWIPQPVELTGEHLALALHIRSRLASDRGHPRQHLGEAESIAYAVQLVKSGTDATILAEDRDAIRQAEFRKLKPMQTTDLIAEMAAMGDATKKELRGIYRCLVTLGRLPSGLSELELFG